MCNPAVIMLLFDVLKMMSGMLRANTLKNTQYISFIYVCYAVAVFTNKKMNLIIHRYLQFYSLKHVINILKNVQNVYKVSQKCE